MSDYDYRPHPRDWHRLFYGMSSADTYNPDSVNEWFADQVARLVEHERELCREYVNDCYHPEFGSEWMPDGSLYKILKETEERVREEEARKIERLLLNPANSETPHCIEEYNAGLENAIAVLRGQIPELVRNAKG